MIGILLMVLFCSHPIAILTLFVFSLGEEAKRVFGDAQNMLNRVINEKLITAVGQVGFYPANSEGDDITVYSPIEGDNRSVIGTFYGLRQQVCSYLTVFFYWY